MKNEKLDPLEEKIQGLEEFMVNIEPKINRIPSRQKSSKKTPNIAARKNYPLHFLVEKDLIESLREEAKEKRISP